jgi:hypothetical protein
MRGYWKLKQEVPDCTLVKKSICKRLRVWRRTDYGVLTFMTPQHRCFWRPLSLYEGTLKLLLVL